jgi:hypothetical protein
VDKTADVQVKFSIPNSMEKIKLNIFRKELHKEKKVGMFPYGYVNGTKL